VLHDQLGHVGVDLGHRARTPTVGRRCFWYLFGAVAHRQGSGHKTALKQSDDARPHVIGDGRQEHLIHDAVQIRQLLPGFLVSRVNALAHADGPQAFLDDLLLEELEAAIRHTEQAAHLEYQQHASVFVLQDGFHPLEPVAARLPAAHALVHADKIGRHVDSVVCRE